MGYLYIIFHIVILNIIIFLCSYQCLEFSKISKNIIFGVTIPTENLYDDYIKNLIIAYKNLVKRFRNIMLIINIICIGYNILTLKNFNMINILLFIFTIYIIIILFNYVIIKYNRLIALYKQSNNLQILDDSIIDEDKYWKYGIMYYNPSDKRFFVPNRIGYNYVFNLPYKLQYIIYGIIFIIIMVQLFLPFLLN